MRSNCRVISAYMVIANLYILCRKQRLNLENVKSNNKLKAKQPKPQGYTYSLSAAYYNFYSSTA